jgi:hypothetical protein
MSADTNDRAALEGVLRHATLQLYGASSELVAALCREKLAVLDDPEWVEYVERWRKDYGARPMGWWKLAPEGRLPEWQYDPERGLELKGGDEATATGPDTSHGLREAMGPRRVEAAAPTGASRPDEAALREALEMDVWYAIEDAWEAAGWPSGDERLRFLAVTLDAIRPCLRPAVTEAQVREAFDAFHERLCDIGMDATDRLCIMQHAREVVGERLGLIGGEE